jgi:glycerol-3-phosphate acyltransferase PlsY
MGDPIDWSAAAPLYVAALLFGYLLGSIPFGLLITRASGLGDIRSIGSGNIGMTNVLRTGRKDLAALTLLGDALKGTLAVLIAGTWGTDMAIVAGLGAFLGHCFPVWLGFRGGKGVATYLGVTLGLFWPAGLFFAFVWIGTAALTRYSSLSALIASAATPGALVLLGHLRLAEAALLMTALLWWFHRGNIRRLVAGEESRIGRKQ